MSNGEDVVKLLEKNCLMIVSAYSSSTSLYCQRRALEDSAAQQEGLKYPFIVHSI